MQIHTYTDVNMCIKQICVCVCHIFQNLYLTKHSIVITIFHTVYFYCLAQYVNTVVKDMVTCTFTTVKTECASVLCPYNAARIQRNIFNILSSVRMQRGVNMEVFQSKKRHAFSPDNRFLRLFLGTSRLNVYYKNQSYSIFPHRTLLTRDIKTVYV